jgi:hypothetical protein
MTLAVWLAVTAKDFTVPKLKHATEHDHKPADSSYVTAIYIPMTFLISCSVYFLTVHMIAFEKETGLSSPFVSFPILSSVPTLQKCPGIP